MGLIGVEIQRESAHLAFAVVAHEFAALLHQPERAFEREDLRGNERRVLAETVSRGDGGFETVVGQLPEDLQARKRMGQQRRLRIPRQVELVLGVLERQLRDVVTEHFAGSCVDVPGNGELLVEVAAHARVLGPLPREDVEDVSFVIEHSSLLRRSLRQFT